MAIFYFDAPAGSGKTHVLVEQAHRMARQGQKLLFVQPSRELISRTISEMLQAFHPTYPFRQMTSDTHGGNVVAAIIGHFRDTPRNQGEILFITHAAFLLLPFLERARDWTVIVDEVLQVDLFESFNIPDTHKLITDALAFEPGDGGYGRLRPAISLPSSFSVDQIARNPRSDQVLAQFSGFAHRIKSENWEVYGNKDSFERLIAGHKGGQLQTYSLLGATIFERFAKTIIASACFTNTMLYQLWFGRGVQMQPVEQDFFDGLRYQQHRNGAHVTIRYVQDEHWSKTKRDMVVDGGGTFGEAIIAQVGQVLDGEPFVWMGNKDQSGAFDLLPNATQLPNSPHGRNDFQQFHNVVVLSALNAPPTHFTFMETLGVSSDALKTAHYRSAVYQAMMRCSIRNPKDATPKTIIVMDRPTAHWLADCFPGACVEQLNIKVALPHRPRGRPCVGAVALTAAERARRCRQNKREGNSVTAYGSVFSSMFATISALQLELDTVDDAGFIALLAELHQREVKAKDENVLISPATFDPAIAGVQTQRGLDNVTQARGIWLDFDDGDLGHEDFAVVFPAVRFAAFNTYSSTATNKRWRAFIPTSRNMSAAEYASVVWQIERQLVDQRWGDSNSKGRRHGLDASKMHAASMFYAPCQAADRAASFFHDHNDQARTALDVDHWLAAATRMSAAQVSTISTNMPVADQVDHEAVAQAITAWRSAPAGTGHLAFYALSVRLKRAGLSSSDVELLLKREATHAHSPNERRAEISGLIASLGSVHCQSLTFTKQAAYPMGFDEAC